MVEKAYSKAVLAVVGQPRVDMGTGQGTESRTCPQSASLAFFGVAVDVLVVDTE